MSESTIERGNWSRKDPGDDIEDGSVINGGNFSQAVPNTIIMAGKPLTINGGNWINVVQDPAWVINGGKWAMISYCTNEFPEMIPGNPYPCEENCEHVVDTDEVRIDGVLVDTIYHYKSGRVI